MKTGGRTGAFDGFLQVYAALIFGFLLLPMLVIVVFSFNDYPYYSLPLRGFTLNWYRELFTSPAVVDSLITSLTIAVLSAVGATLLGSAAAYALVRYRFRGRAFIGIISIAPLVTPLLILGISFQLLFRYLGLPLSIWTVTVAHITYTTPFVLIIVVARLLTFDFTLERAAQDLGASPARTFLLVTFPIIRWAIIGGGLFAFLLSFNEFIIAFFTGGPRPTLPILIWSMLKVGIKPTLLAYSSLIIVLALAGCLLAVRLAGELLGRQRK